MPNKYQDATNRYLGWLGVVCLIILPFIGPGAIVVWALTAMTLYGITKSLMRQPPPESSSKPPCSRKGSQRKRRRRDHSRNHRGSRRHPGRLAEVGYSASCFPTILTSWNRSCDRFNPCGPELAFNTMTISVSLRLSPSLDPNDLKGLPASVLVSPGRMTLRELNRLDWNDVREALQQHLTGSVEVRPTLTDLTSCDWSHPDEDHLGAVLMARDYLKPLNSQADYAMPEAWPACSVFKPEACVDLPTKPTGLVVSVGDEDIFSSKMTNLLGSEFCLQPNSVSYNGERLTSWGRLKSTPDDNVLDASSLAPEQPCAISGAPLIPTRGVFVAQPDAQTRQTFWRDKLGSGYNGQRRHLCVSTDIAEKIQSRDRQQTVRLIPIWRYESGLADLVRQVIDDCGR